MKTILITGGSHGIGEGLVQYYLNQDYVVYNMDLKAPDITHENYHYLACDITDKQKVKSYFESLPHIDSIVLNAATYDTGSFLTTSIEKIEKVISVNLLSHIYLAKLYANQFSKTHGRIVMLSSTRSFMSEANTIGYSVSKGGINALTHALALTLQEKHITVNSIAPGWINTWGEEPREEDHLFHPSNRVGMIEDIVRAVAFLVDEKADFINGEIITIDGGVTKKMIYPE